MPKGTPVPDESYAPYAPYRTVREVLARFRDRGLPDPLTPDLLEQIGVPSTISARTLRALRFLGLVDEGGNRLDAFERLKRARTEEYPQQLEEVVRAAYLPVFTVVDPAADSDTALADAFRRYEPSAQRDRMIALFRGLSEEAGIIPRDHPQERRGALVPRARQHAPPADKAPVRPRGVSSMDQGNEDEQPGIDYRLITAIIQQLPRDGRWSKQRRDRWMATMQSAVDLLIETEAQVP